MPLIRLLSLSFALMLSPNCGTEEEGRGRTRYSAAAHGATTSRAERSEVGLVIFERHAQNNKEQRAISDMEGSHSGVGRVTTSLTTLIGPNFG